MAELAVLGLVMILGLGAYWSMVIFPRQRDFQKREQYVSALSVGAEVITYTGMVGRITAFDLDRGVVFVEIAPNVVVRIMAQAIAREYDPNEFAPETSAAVSSVEPTASST
ncbi:MAG: preprotein translocase subunit YajC [Chloroflexota bacterium]|nr:preprotein translocase subunit YajC [Chloroflexota bacterium]